MTNYGFIAFLLIGPLVSPNLVLDPDPDMHGMDMAGYEHYLGHPIVSGAYRIGGEGELYMSLDRRSSQAFPHSGGKPIVIYVGDSAGVALEKLGIARAAQAIDMDHVCGLTGHATVELSGLWTGIHADRREYQSDLVRVISKTAAHLENCSGVTRQTLTTRSRWTAAPPLNSSVRAHASPGFE
jgi:hypothetical protein